MLRITTSNENGTVWIKLEGKLVGPWVAACREECARLARSGVPFQVDLSAVGFVDGSGEEFLRGLLGTGVLGQSSSFVRELLWPRASRARERERAVQRHLPELLALARRLLRHGAEAAEAVQRAYLAGFPVELGPEHASDLGADLRSHLIDACIARARARSGTPSDAIEAFLPRFDHAGNHAAPIRPWPAPGGVGRDALLSATRRSFDDLPEPHRLVVVLHDVEGLALGEIARRMELSPADVRRCLHQARQALIGLVTPALRSAAGHALEGARTA